MAGEGLRQVEPQHVPDLVAVTSLVLSGEEDQGPRVPVVVGRHLVIEAEHLRPAAEEGRGVRQLRRLRLGLFRLGLGLWRNRRRDQLVVDPPPPLGDSRRLADPAQHVIRPADECEVFGDADVS